MFQAEEENGEVEATDDERTHSEDGALKELVDIPAVDEEDPNISPCHKLALVDLFTEANIKVRELNIPQYRLQKKKRQKREQDYIKSVYDSLTKKGNTLLVKLANMKIQNNTGEVVTNFRELLSSGNDLLDDIIRVPCQKYGPNHLKIFKLELFGSS